MEPANRNGDVGGRDARRTRDRRCGQHVEHIVLAEERNPVAGKDVQLCPGLDAHDVAVAHRRPVLRVDVHAEVAHRAARCRRHGAGDRVVVPEHHVIDRETHDALLQLRVLLEAGVAIEMIGSDVEHARDAAPRLSHRLDLKR